ncbi:uncharacterized protein LOC111403838 [Olea europaea var. sylvestris]|uniref:uncharacterized protein LOC111403838 n=1 Tax=Olea europaea var. sylvestris TaxID=158386 RepID=UPI000C1CF0E6|nr:uncharacterized protein LOC111403838 [Olea europaea var. sylvestris]
MGPTQDSRILAHAVHSPDIHFSEPVDGKYYLVDSGFAHRQGYMAPYKGSDVRYHFQEFHDHAALDVDFIMHTRGFHRAKEVDDEEVKVELPDEEDEPAAEEDAVGDENVSWTQLRDYIAYTIR